jgi:hypothetical protein
MIILETGCLFSLAIHSNLIYILYSLCLVLYGCEIWSLTLKREHREVLRRIFGPKRDEVTRDWRKLYNKELRKVRACIARGENEKCKQNFGWKA